jgi:hypothetical protein
MTGTANTPERMTAWEFLRWYAANSSHAELILVAATMTLTTIAAACWPVTGALLPGWAAVLAGAASLAFYLAFVWLVLGSGRVQQWIIGSGVS